MQVVAIACTVASVPSARANEFPPDSGLDIYWIDVEGGAATLLVTPAGETILIDTGLPGERHASRIEHVVEDVVGAEKIDHLVVTHFDIDHYGGAVDLAKRVEIAKVWDPGIPGSHRFDRAGPERFRDYAELFAERRTVIAPGDEIPLRAADSRAPLSIRCLAARQRFITPRPGQESGDGCGELELAEIDRSENRNSAVLLIRCGPFDLLDAADLTWNLERQLVCPINLVGKVDVFQVDHHGLDASNNPALVRSIEPTVAVFNNGPTKGAMPKTVATLRSVPSIRAI
ncbi:MAG TPA: MBL fold metallo-hydrolase, partial [Planctomycetota bacterium]|nr:MBL fold metallo-hydrolase [Planctomycetota bacterium]